MQGIVIELMTARFLFYSNSSKSNEKLFGKRSESKCKCGYVRGHVNELHNGDRPIATKFN